MFGGGEFTEMMSSMCAGCFEPGTHGARHINVDTNNSIHREWQSHHDHININDGQRHESHNSMRMVELKHMYVPCYCTRSSVSSLAQLYIIHVESA